MSNDDAALLRKWASDIRKGAGGRPEDAELLDRAAAAVQAEGRFGSTNDARAENSSTRQTYRTLSEMEKAQVESVKELGDWLIRLCHEIGGTDPDGERCGSRDLSLAVTHVEDAVMRAVRHITR